MTEKHEALHRIDAAKIDRNDALQCVAVLKSSLAARDTELHAG